MPAKARLKKRRKYFIKKRFQTNFFIRFAILLILESFLIAGLFMYLSSGTLTTGYSGSQLTIERTSEFFSSTFLIIALIVGVIVALAGMLTFMLLSHRLAGPLYRFERSLENISRGDLTYRIKLRSADQLTDLQESLNKFTENMERQIIAMKVDVSESLRLFSKKEDPQSLKYLEERLNKLKEGMESFKTSSIEKG
ncbi:MAG: methyl-accepting chemotaxis protein [Nitrospirae bacterium]|nr:methyl-accepting chemotaxis protein [Nitrospirota bacterium]